MDVQTRIIDLTVGELIAIISREVAEQGKEIAIAIESRMNQEVAEKPKPLYGTKGMAEALHCSVSKVMRLKNAGHLEGGYQQMGSTIIVRDPQALRDIAEHSLRKSKRKNGQRTTKSVFI